MNLLLPPPKKILDPPLRVAKYSPPALKTRITGKWTAELRNNANHFNTRDIYVDRAEEEQCSHLDPDRDHYRSAFKERKNIE